MATFLRRPSAVVAIVIVLGLATVSCSSDGESTSTQAPADTNASTDAVTATTEVVEPVTSDEPVTTDAGSADELACVGSGDGAGEPIIIGSINTEESGAGNFGDITDGAEACFNAINDSGGIDGRPIDFQRCNDSADPVQGETCARDFIDKGAIAVLGGICFSCFSAPIVDLLGEAGIPYIGGLPVLPDEYENTNWYPITNAGGSAALYANSAWMMLEAEKKGVEPTVTEIYAAVGEADPTLENRISELGGTYVNRIGFDPAAADLSSIAQQAIDTGANFVSVQTDGPNTVKLVTALRTQGYEGDITILGTSSDPQSIEGMGDASEGVFVAGFFEDLVSSDSPDAVKYRADLETSGTDPAKGLAGIGYAGALAAAVALADAGEDVTSESFLAALTSLGPIQPLFNGNLAAANAADEFPRTYYFSSYAQTIQDGEIVQTGDVFNFLTGEAVS